MKRKSRVYKKALFICQNRWFLLAVALIISFTNLHAQTFSYFVEVYQFQTAKAQAYLEVHTNIHAEGLHFIKTASGKYVASLDQVLFIQDSESEEEAGALRVTIKSEEMVDSTGAIKGLLLTDVRKIPVKPGKITLTGVIYDNNAIEKKEYAFEKEVWVEEKAVFSDVLFIDEFVKAEAGALFSRFGKRARPRAGGALFQAEKELWFYTEMYGLQELVKGDAYFLTCFISDQDADTRLAGLSKTSKRALLPLDVYGGSFDISKLPTGGYYLNVEVYNAKNEKVKRSTAEFWVKNEVEGAYVAYSVDDFDKLFGLTEPEIDYYLRPLKYIATSLEQDTIKHYLNDFSAKKKFYYYFWDRKKKRPHDSPAKEAEIFKARVKYVNENYKSVYLEGWKTDRGRIFLKYGPPNNVDPFPAQSNGVPHEIWFYNKLGTQANVQFVFVDWDLNTGDYNLAHSTKFGERSNPGWSRGGR